jgi:DNA repair ATPase RecN
MPQASAETEGADGAMREGQSAMRELSRQLSDFAGEMSTAVRSFSKERKQVARELSELVSHSQGMNLREAQLRVQLAMQNDRMAAQRVGTFAP